jgi:hypothetical protein
MPAMVLTGKRSWNKLKKKLHEAHAEAVVCLIKIGKRLHNNHIKTKTKKRKA